MLVSSDPSGSTGGLFPRYALVQGSARNCVALYEGMNRYAPSNVVEQAIWYS